MAAGRPIGTMYAEINLDRTKYDKALQDVLASSETGAVKVEKAWKNLGIKTDEVYTKMKANAVLSYEAIAKSGVASADEIRRAEEAKNEKLRRLNDQQFGHQTTIIESLKKNWIAAAAVIGTAMVAASKAWDMAKVGADYEEQRGILDNLGRKYGQTSESIVASMEKASDGLVAKSDLMQIALGGIAKGLKPEQLTNLADAARILGDSVGKDATTALNDLTQALETGKTKALKGYLGTTIDLESAFGDLYETLTETEKANALYSITMIEATKLQSQQTGAVDDAGDKIERLEAKYKNLTTTMSIWAKTAVVWLFDMEGWKRGALAMSGIDIPEASGDNRFANPSEAPFDAAGKQNEVIAGYEKQIDALKNLVKARKDDEGAIKATAKTQDDYAKAVEDRAERELKALLKSSEESAKERIKQDEAVYLKEMALFEETEKENAKYLDDMKKDKEKAAEDEKKLSLKRLKIERDIYSDIRGYEKDYSDDAIDLMWEQVQEYEKAGVSQVAINAWITEEMYKNDLKKLKSSKNWADGVHAYFKEAAHDAQEWGTTAYNAVKAFSKNAESQMSDNFFAVMKGRFEDIRLDWESLWDSMLRVVSDRLAQMAVTATTNAAWSYLSSAAAWIAPILGFSEGAWEVKKAQMAVLHPGEMVLPADEAAQYRNMPGASQHPDMATPMPTGTVSDWGSFVASQTMTDMGQNIGKSTLSAIASTLGLSLAFGVNPTIGMAIAASMKSGLKVALIDAVKGLLAFARIGERGQQLGFEFDTARANDLAAMADVGMAFGQTSFGQSVQAMADLGMDFGATSAGQAAAAADVSAMADVGMGFGDYGGGGMSGAGEGPTGDDGMGGPSGSPYWRGGLARRKGTVAEKGPEWVVPTLEPERSGFLKNMGADPETLGKAIAKNMRGGGGNVLHLHFPNAIVVDKSAVNDLAEIIFPRLKQLEAWGHG